MGGRKTCGFGLLNFRHPEYGKSIGWETSIGEVFGTLGCSPQMTVTPTNPVNECNGDFATVVNYNGTDHRNPQTSMSTECNRIAYQLASTINGEAWYGDSLRQILKEVTAKQAQAHPIPNAHSIWELLCHVEAWVKFALGAVGGAPIPAWPAMPVELDWPTVTNTSDPPWKQALLKKMLLNDERKTNQ